MPAPSQLDRFKRAMQVVYGPFESLSQEQAAQWTPPENSGGHRGRYLWTDAFGVLNFLTLYKETTDRKYISLADNLIKTVHAVLGSTRDRKSRLPGAVEENPLGGGLRIGKMDEYGSDGDGQYHHYLSIWMFALNRMAIASGESNYNTQAIALAKAIHPHFFHDVTSAAPRMYWKIAMDMSRPLVASEGNLDAVDGFVVFRLLAAASGDPQCLADEVADYQRVIDRKGMHAVSNDTLDLGMSLWIAHWSHGTDKSAQQLGSRCLEKFDSLADQGLLESNFRRRLAFRDFGACLGLRCYRGDDPNYEPLAERLLVKWEIYVESQPEDLRPINQVMYAAAMIPGAFKKEYFGPELSRNSDTDGDDSRPTNFPSIPQVT
ncbi:MAG: hypothetical protein Q9166_007590 [cf. Caloplaca sp. 2 TL-2023]